jgi:hypothetical protein
MRLFDIDENKNLNLKGNFEFFEYSNYPSNFKFNPKNKEYLVLIFSKNISLYRYNFNTN